MDHLEVMEGDSSIRYLENYHRITPSPQRKTQNPGIYNPRCVLKLQKVLEIFYKMNAVFTLMICSCISISLHLPA
jgi:hypothetical protein